jgi:hypothetical protein
MSISTRSCTSAYTLSNTINSKSFIGLIKHFHSRESFTGATLVTDNHLPYYSRDTKDILTSIGFEICFITRSSFLNTIEFIWVRFKSQIWTKFLAVWLTFHRLAIGGYFWSYSQLNYLKPCSGFLQSKGFSIFENILVRNSRHLST